MLRLCLLFALTLPIPARAGDPTGPARVVDGDTLGLATPGGEAIIRLHGIDAPERAQTCLDATGAARRCGDEAAAALTALIGGTMALIAAITRKAFTNEALLDRLDRELITERDRSDKQRSEDRKADSDRLDRIETDIRSMRDMLFDAFQRGRSD